MITITSSSPSSSSLVTECEPLALVVDLALIGRTAAPGVNEDIAAASQRFDFT